MPNEHLKNIDSKKIKFTNKNKKNDLTALKNIFNLDLKVKEAIK